MAIGGYGCIFTLHAYSLQVWVSAIYTAFAFSFLTNTNMKKILISLAVIGVFLLAGCSDFRWGAVSDLDEDGEEISPRADIESLSSNHKFMQTALPENGEKIAVITTNFGKMEARLFPDKTPETVKNFTELAASGKYNGTIFHRVIKDFMIQGGDFENANGTGGHSYKGPGTSIQDEFDPDLKNIRGALSMANRGPNTGGSQFFIVHAQATSWLDGKHAVFGQVYEGLDILDKIAMVETNMWDVPVNEVVIEKIEILGLQ